MPLLKTRQGPDDGGFAVSSYSEINPKLGTMQDFEELNDIMRKEGIATCIDFVANHTAKEHEWAMRARAGEKEYQDMYYMYDSYDIPSQFEKHLANTFPELAPGNFTYQNDIHKWVFTTFYEFQWDLNYKNPNTLNKVIKEMLFLLNRGVDVIRIDAIRHIWKEVGTDCSNLPQVHVIVAIIKVVTSIVAPGVIFLGEAVTSQRNILEYFGTKQNGCELMYNVTLMTSLWSSLATRNVKYMQHCMQNSPKLPEGVALVNYIRCHDDADFIIEEHEIQSLGLSSFWHKQFLIDFYKGSFPGSFSRGEIYSYDERTRNARISGTLASMCGLEKGLYEHDRFQVDYAYRRILLLYGVLLTFHGIPLIYSCDEIATLNDYSYKHHQEKRIDSRWLHRSKFNWHKAELRHNMTTSEGVVFNGLKKLIAIRKNEPVFHSAIPIVTFDTWNHGVFGGFKKLEGETFVLLANFTEHYQYIDVNALKNTGFNGLFTDLIQNQELSLESQNIYLKPYEFLWLKQ
jgi:glycosidase